MTKAGARTAARRSCLVLQIGDHVRSSALQRGDEAEDEASYQREPAGEGEHAEIHPDRQLHGDVSGRCERRQDARGHPGDEESGTASQNGEQQTFDQELAN